MADEKRKGLFDGPLGHLLMGGLTAAAVGNPIGMVAAPMIMLQRQMSEQAKDKSERTARWDDAKWDAYQSIPRIFANQSAGANPITGEPVAMEEGLTNPYDNRGEMAQLGTMFPNLIPPQSSRQTMAERTQEAIAILKANGVEPTPEMIQQLVGAAGAPVDPAVARTNAINEEIAKTRLAMLQTEQQETESEIVRRSEAARDSVGTMSNVLFEVSDAMDVLDSSPLLAPGVPFSQEIGQAVSVWDRLASATGIDDDGQRRKALDAQQKLIKNSDRFVSEYLNFREANGMGSPTVSYMNLVKNFSPNTAIGAPTIRGIVAATAADMLKAADRLPQGYGLDPQVRSQLEREVAKYRSSAKSFSMDDADTIKALLDTGAIRPGDVIMINGEPVEATPEDFM